MPYFEFADSGWVNNPITSVIASNTSLCLSGLLHRNREVFTLVVHYLHQVATVNAFLSSGLNE